MRNFDYIDRQIGFISDHLAVHDTRLPYNGEAPPEIMERLPYTLRGVERLCIGLAEAGWDNTVDVRTPLGVRGAQYSLLEGAVRGFEERLRTGSNPATAVKLNGFRELPTHEAYAAIRRYGYFHGMACNLGVIRFALHRLDKFQS